MDYVTIVKGPALAELKAGNMQKIMEFTVRDNDGEKQIHDLVEVYDRSNEFGTVLIIGAKNWAWEYLPKK